MHILKITDGCDDFINCTNNENQDNIIICKSLLLSIPSSLIFLSIWNWRMYTLSKPLKKMKDKVQNFRSESSTPMY